MRGIDAEQGEVMKQGGRVVVTPGASAFAVLGMDGRRHHIVTLTRREAERCLKITVGGQDYLVSSDADLFVEDGRLVLHGEAGTDPTVTSFPELPRHLFDGVADVGIELTLEGDVAELYAGTELLDDQFLNGTPWHLSLGHFRAKLARRNLLLKITPLTKKSPVYREYAPDFDEHGVAIGLAAVRLIPEYERVMEL